jgi:hypothetical protein
VAKLCTSFHEHQVVFLGFILSLLCSDLAFLIQIGLVANQHYNDVVASFRSNVVNPLFRVLKGLGI